MERTPEEHVQDVLVERGISLATAESATGGLLGDRITSVPGSSAYYMGGVIAYANDVKEHVLGVPKELMIEHGAVSSETALAMARGVRQLLQTDYGISITGIAGPGGGSAEKPVGLTWVAVSGPAGDRAERHIYPGDRNENKHAAVDSVLELLLEDLNVELGEPIQVETRRDADDRVVPVAFHRDGKRYTIQDWGRRWVESGRQHMLVRTARMATYEISHDPEAAAWRLVRKLHAPGRPADLA